MKNLRDRKPVAVVMRPPLASIIFMFGLLIAPIHARAQLPGTGAVVSMRLSAAEKPVQGWSIKHGLLGRAVYASAEGKQIGTVLDVVVTSAASPFVLIVGAAGSLSIGGHSVAVPLVDMVEQGGVLILPNATRSSLKAMPRFTYSKAAIHRAQFIRETSTQLVQANAQLKTRQKRAAAETGATRTQLELEDAALQTNITAAEDKLADLEKAELSRWVLLRGDLQEAMARVLVAIPQLTNEPATTLPRRP